MPLAPESHPVRLDDGYLWLRLHQSYDRRDILLNQGREVSGTEYGESLKDCAEKSRYHSRSSLGAGKSPVCLKCG